MLLRPIGYIETGFQDKFGVPRQSGLADAAHGRIVFREDLRDPNCTRGLETYSYIWVLWGFSKAGAFSPTVRPPRLGGNRRIGVFATRSPFRPNPIALSSVRMLSVEVTETDGPVITFAGADMVDNSPVYDIKPYIPADIHPEAETGFASIPQRLLAVADPDGFLDALPDHVAEAVRQALALDPRPAYHDSPHRVYGMTYAGCDVRFRVEETVLHIVDMRKAPR